MQFTKVDSLVFFLVKLFWYIASSEDLYNCPGILSQKIMNDTESPRLEEQQSKIVLKNIPQRVSTNRYLQYTAPTKSPFANVRTDGRAFNSANWRMKAESPATPSRTNASPSASPNPNPNTSRAAFSRPGAHVPQAINDGRRLYVGNMPYTAKMEDVEALFIAAEFPMYACT